MIQIIYGKKGSGKTKRIIDLANTAAKEHDGNIVFIDDDNRYMFDLKHEVRFINATDYSVSSPEMFLGFVSGIIASNYDLSLLFIDGFLRIVHARLEELETFFARLSDYTAKAGVTLVLSVSGDSDELPAFLADYRI